MLLDGNGSNGSLHPDPLSLPHHKGPPFSMDTKPYTSHSYKAPLPSPVIVKPEFPDNGDGAMRSPLDTGYPPSFPHQQSSPEKRGMGMDTSANMGMTHGK